LALEAWTTVEVAVDSCPSREYYSIEQIERCTDSLAEEEGNKKKEKAKAIYLL
jgi:hypothetical protein